jgi:hypothetical protein
MRLNLISQSWSLLLKRSRISVAALLIPLALIPCAIASQRVVDTNGNPLEGVAIIESWVGDVWNPVDSRSACKGAAITFTDKNGKFSPRSNPRWWAGGDKAGITIYKRGYMLKVSEKGVFAENGVFTMEPYDGSFDRIVWETGNYPYGFGCKSEEQLKRDGLCAVLRDLGEERARQANAEVQLSSAQGSLLMAARCESDYKEAERQRNAILAKAEKLAAPNFIPKDIRRVIDSGNGKPIEGAIVLHQWKLDIAGPSKCRTLSVSITDKDGIYPWPKNDPSDLNNGPSLCQTEGIGFSGIVSFPGRPTEICDGSVKTRTPPTDTGELIAPKNVWPSGRESFWQQLFYKKGFYTLETGRRFGTVLTNEAARPVNDSKNRVFALQSFGLGCGQDEKFKAIGMCSMIHEIGEEQKQQAKTDDERKIASQTLMQAVECESGKGEAERKAADIRQQVQKVHEDALVRERTHKLVEETSGKPLEGVLVIQHWMENVSTDLQRPSYLCKHAQISMTGKDGAYIEDRPQGLTHTGPSGMLLHKKGFAYLYYINKGKDISMRKDGGGFDDVVKVNNQRALDKNHLGIGCGLDKQFKNAGLCPKLKEIGDELKKRARTSADNEQASTVLQTAAMCESATDNSKN